MENSLQKAILLIGGQVKTAAVLTEYHQRKGDIGRRIYQSHVWKWLRKSKNGIPAEYCRAIEHATNGAVTRFDLRPDVFGTPDDQPTEVAQ